MIIYIRWFVIRAQKGLAVQTVYISIVARETLAQLTVHW